MNISSVLSEKRETNAKIKDKYSLLQKYKSIGLIVVKDEQVAKQLAGGLEFLSGAFIIYIEWSDTKKHKNVVVTWELDTSLIAGFDFVVACDEIEDLPSYLQKWVVPLICSSNPMSALFSQFNAVKNTWNAFLFESVHPFSIYAAIVQYLENYKFAFDNKNAIKNVLGI